MWKHPTFTNGPAQQIQNLPLYSVPWANIESQGHHCVYQLCDSITEVSLENIRRFWICCAPIIFSRFWSIYGRFKKIFQWIYFFPFLSSYTTWGVLLKVVPWSSDWQKVLKSKLPNSYWLFYKGYTIVFMKPWLG